MRSLFLRIFLLFWLAMALVAAVLVVTSPLFTRSRPGLEDWHRDAESWARSAVDRAAEHIEEAGVGGRPRGRGHGQGAEHGGGPPMPARIFVLDDTGRELRGAKAPQEVLDIADRVLSAGEEISERSGMLYLVARPVVDPEGRSLAVVAAHHSPPRLVHLLDPKALAWRLGALFLVVGGLSFWLARYLSSPVAPLRSATRRLSGGDLSARVGGKVAGRKDEIGELARDFDAMAERIEGLVGSQHRLLRDVSHELRSPLARLAVALELARGRAGEAAAGPLDRIELEAARLDELIGQLLLLERLEAAHPEGDAVKIDLGALLSEVVADAGFEAAAGGTEVRLDPGGGGRISGRPELLRSAFDNVIRNAVQHAEPGSVVEVGLTTVGDGVTVVIRDHGDGLDEAELERIFEPFYRVDESRQRASGGVGLGLSIARRAVQAHGGSMAARNHEDGGLEIVVRLPSTDSDREPGA
jgi:two-component system sensor histidine kinase CpxA